MFGSYGALIVLRYPYLGPKAYMSVPERTHAKTSATVMEYQMPSIPKNIGIKIAHNDSKTPVRSPAMVAEIAPLPSAVKNDEA
jgi:hypothetical protein